MFENDLVSFGVYFGSIFATLLPILALKKAFKLSFEVVRKMYHLVIVLSFIPLMEFFSSWYVAVLAAIGFAAIVYPILALVENSSLFKWIAVEREGGEFKRSMIVTQVTFALLICVFWGLLGPDWRYVAVVAVMAWGFGDAAAALVGKKFGRKRIHHPRIDGPKTMEGTQAMWFTAALATFLTLLLYAGLPWEVSLAVALLVAPVCAIVELFTQNGLDTLTVPVSASLALLSLLSLFSFMGL